MLKMNCWNWVALLLIIIGALNWGLVGLFNFDLVAAIFGQMSAWARVIYTIVGISAVYLVIATAISSGVCKGRVAWLK